MGELERIFVAVGLPKASALELQDLVKRTSILLNVGVVEAESNQVNEMLGFEWKKEAIVWATITAVGSAASGIGLNVVASYAYDYLRAAKPQTELMIRDQRGNLLYLQQTDASNVQNIEAIVREFFLNQPLPKKP